MRNKLANLIPEDTVFLEKENEIDKSEEDKINIKDYNNSIGIFLFSKTLYNNNWF